MPSLLRAKQDGRLCERQGAPIVVYVSPGSFVTGESAGSLPSHVPTAPQRQRANLCRLCLKPLMITDLSCTTTRQSAAAIKAPLILLSGYPLHAIRPLIILRVDIHTNVTHGRSHSDLNIIYDVLQNSAGSDRTQARQSSDIAGAPGRVCWRARCGALG